MRLGEGWALVPSARRSRVFLVRHAMPLLDPKLPPSGWALSPEGCSAARGIAGRLPADATAMASTEVKAQQTLRWALGVLVDGDAGFDEVHRPVELIGPDVRAARRAWVAGRLDERHEGWERPDLAAARFERAIRSAPSGDLIVGTHGMVLTAWLVARGAVVAGEAAARFWERLAFPDVVEVER